MTQPWQACWVTPPLFQDLRPIDLSHKQMSRSPQIEESIRSLRNVATLVRSTIDLEEGRKGDYVLRISADDHFVLWINGVYVGEGPAPSDPRFAYYLSFDITPYLKEGTNAIAIRLYYQGLVNRVRYSGDGRCAFVTEILLDGTPIAFTGSEDPDPVWLSIQDPHLIATSVYGYETQFNETCDARLELHGWKTCEPNEHWQPMRTFRYEPPQLIPQPTPPITIEPIKPKTIIRRGEAWFIDWGQEYVGTVVMDACGLAGDTIIIIHAEELDASGELVTPLRCGPNYREQWILSGQHDHYQTFEYKAFRYTEIVDPDSKVDRSSITLLSRHYPLSERAVQFRSSNPTIQGIWDICHRAVVISAQEHLTDCPTREKGQYLGDVTVSGLAHIYVAGDEKLMAKSLRDTAWTADLCPGLMAVAPGAYMQEIADYSLLYPYQVWKVYEYTGDSAYLTDYLPICEGMLRYFERFAREDGLIEHVNEKWNLVDWPADARDHYAVEVDGEVSPPCHNVLNAYYIGAVKVVEQMRTALGLSNESQFMKLYNAYQRAFFQASSGLYTDVPNGEHCSLHSNLQPLFWGLIPAENLNRIVAFIKQKGLACGVFNSYFLLKGLCQVGEHALALRLILNESDRSWVTMLREGATTCFEAWSKEQKWNTSLCHPWAAAPILVILEDILGFDPASGGFHPTEAAKLLGDFHVTMGFKGKCLALQSNDLIEMGLG